MKLKSELLRLQAELENQQNKVDQSEEKFKEIENERGRLENRVAELEQMLASKEAIVQDMDNECQRLKEQIDSSFLNDKGQQTLLGFKLIPPYLDKVLGRPFFITVSEEFNYKTAPDRERLDEIQAGLLESEPPGFHNFRDRIKPDHSFRVGYFYSTREYFLDGPGGKTSLINMFFPADMNGGLEITSQFRSAMYLAIQNRELQSAALAKEIFGAPLLSYAFPIMDEQDRPVGAVSFSNDITQIVRIARELGRVVSDDADTTLEKLANVLNSELEVARQAADLVRQEALGSQRIAETIRTKGKEVIEISERLNVLAINTAIESSKVGAQGKGVSVIANQMKQISDITGKTLKEIFDESLLLDNSSKQILEHSQGLESSAADLREESNVLFETSKGMSSQKNKLARLVQLSIEEISQNQGDLDAIKALVD